MWRLLLLPTALALRNEQLHAHLDLEVERLGALTEFHRLIDEEKLSSTPLFYTEKEGRFATAAELLSQDPSSVLFRLENGFKTGSNMVVVGTGGAGKTETILLAMENTRKSKASFDLRSWYLNERGLEKGAYNTSVKADQLALLKASEEKVKADLAGKSADVLFFDEVDLTESFPNDDELEALKVLLQWGNEEAEGKAKVVVLHPLACIQPETHSLLSGLGFPVPGAATWIDFSQPYSDQAEEAMVRGMLQACDPPATDAQIAEVKDYFLGLPSAYMPFLVNKNNVLDGLTGPAAEAIDRVVKPAAKAKVGGKLIKINTGFSATHEARAAIKTLRSGPRADVPGVEGAIASMVVEARHGKYIIPPVMLDALTEYCDGADAKGKNIVAPICD